MDRDCGWVQLLAADDERVLGRGRAIVSHAPQEIPSEGAAEHPLTARGQLVPGSGEWSGRLDPLRLERGVRDLELTEHRIRFEQNGETLRIQVRGWERLNGEGQALIESADGLLPTVLLELGGD